MAQLIGFVDMFGCYYGHNNTEDIISLIENKNKYPHVLTPYAKLSRKRSNRELFECVIDLPDGFECDFGVEVHLVTRSKNDVDFYSIVEQRGTLHSESFSFPRIYHGSLVTRECIIKHRETKEILALEVMTHVITASAMSTSGGSTTRKRTPSTMGV